MYNVIHTEEFEEDVKNITHYISDKLSNPIAAVNLIDTMYDSLAKLELFPYMHPVYDSYISRNKLNREYRQIVVGSYSIFYYVIDNEKRKDVYISRVYNHRQIARF